ncbi:MAG: hypothetical protein IKJ51_03455, partial [Clostridia bacterium]|nr:hypothetical protein [Clostridia bacterium]
ENTLLPIGQCDDKADYTYEENVLMQVYGLKDKAFRTVYDRNGEKAFCVKAEKADDQITFSICKETKGLKLQLMGIRNIKSVSGATAKENEKGMLLYVQGTEVKVSL